LPNPGEREPNLLNFVPKNVWREVYQGRWTELRKVQKAEFIVETVFCGLFFGGLSYLGLMREGGFVGFVVPFTAVGAVLAVFFWLLTRSIK
jgi:hypothetical protein